MLRYAVNCSILLTDLPLLERPGAAARAGFSAVEFWWPFVQPTPARDVLGEFVKAITGSGCRLTSLNLFSGDQRRGDAGVLGDRRRVGSFRASLDTVSRIAERTQCRTFNALYGNLAPDVTMEEHDENALEQLLVAARALEGVGGHVLLEPRSTPHFALRTVDKALQVIAAARAEGVTNVGLLADFYHLAVSGQEVASVIEKHLDHVEHIQIADAPGRGAPGTGTLPLRSWLTSCEQRGYDGVVGLEYESAVSDPFGWLPASERSWSVP